MAPPVAFLDQIEVGTGVGSFAAGDDSHILGIVGQRAGGEHVGQLRYRSRVGRVARLAVDVVAALDAESGAR